MTRKELIKLVVLVALPLCLQACKDTPCKEHSQGEINVINHTNEDVQLEFDDVVTDTVLANGEKSYTRFHGHYKIRAIGLTSGESIIDNAQVLKCETDIVDIQW
jgi:hypothetical protein